MLGGCLPVPGTGLLTCTLIGTLSTCPLSVASRMMLPPPRAGGVEVERGALPREVHLIGQGGRMEVCPQAVLEPDVVLSLPGVTS